MKSFGKTSMVSREMKKYIVMLCFALTILVMLYLMRSPCTNSSNNGVMVAAQRYILGQDSKVYVYNRSMPIIFVGGMPRSGTTLLRVLLDAHPDVRCGEETRLIPRVLSLRQQWVRSPVESKRLQEAGITGDVLDNAIASFILEIVARHGLPAPRLCNKDPYTMKSAVYLHSLFPRAKFLLLIRDGRAVIHSIISRKVGVTGYDLTDYRQCLTKWNITISNMFSQCISLGSEICMPVYYEQVVLQPEPWMKSILKFLDIPWNEAVLHHEELVNKPDGIKISKLERSSDQVIKPINIEALTKWVGNIPEDVVRDMASIAPMLSTLGYDPNANPPDYGKPDSFVLKNTNFVKQNEQLWLSKEIAFQKERDELKNIKRETRKKRPPKPDDGYDREAR